MRARSPCARRSYRTSIGEERFLELVTQEDSAGGLPAARAARPALVRARARGQRARSANSTYTAALWPWASVRPAAPSTAASVSSCSPPRPSAPRTRATATSQSSPRSEHAPTTASSASPTARCTSTSCFLLEHPGLKPGAANQAGCWRKVRAFGSDYAATALQHSPQASRQRRTGQRSPPLWANSAATARTRVRCPGLQPGCQTRSRLDECAHEGAYGAVRAADEHHQRRLGHVGHAVVERRREIDPA